MNVAWNRPFELLASWMATPRWTIGASLARIMMGFIVLELCVLHIRQRAFLWGPQGILDSADFRSGGGNSVNLFALGDGAVMFEILFWFCVLVAFCFTIGFLTRIVTPLFGLVTWSLIHRDPFIMDGGWRLLGIMCVWIVVTDLGRHFSVDARLRQGRAPREHWLSTMLHNTAILAIIFQVCVVYTFSVFYKVTGESWQQGTALYYALSDPQFNVSPLNRVILASPLFVTLGTYATLLYQAAFPWLVLHRRLKYAIIATGVLFHAGIAMTMGLYWFSAVMITSETLLLTDREYRWIGDRLNALVTLFKRATAREGRLAAAPVLLEEAP